MLKRLFTLLVAASLLLFQVRPALAAPTEPVAGPAPLPPSPGVIVGAVGDDVVHLKSGGMIRGTLIESIPGDHATVHLMTGQDAVISWALVDRVEANAAPLPAPPAPPAGETGDALVHIQSPRETALERLDDHGQWSLACTAPCDQPLPIGASYRITGHGMRTSSPFTLQARPGDRVELTVNPGSTAAFVTGVVLACASAPVLIVGLLVLEFQLTVMSLADRMGYGSGPDLTTAATILGIGLVAAVGGIALIAFNAHTDVRPSAAAPAPRRDAWLRAPTWREDPARAWMPPAVGAPLFSTTF